MGSHLTGGDWSLQRKGLVDQARHQEKVREAIRANLGEILTDEAILTSDGRTIIKVPMRSLKEYHFRFDPYQERRVGQGTGDSRVGDLVARGREVPGPGGAGQEPGIDYSEAEITVDEISDLFFSELTLPFLREKREREEEARAQRFTEVGRRGALANLDKRRTILENIKRNARRGQPDFRDIQDEDLRFRSVTVRPKRSHNAVVVAMRDVSGSMGEFKKYLSRTFFFWMVRFLRSRYDQVRLVFITHHLEAREVDEETFFHLGESGGTRVSSAYGLALEILRQRFDPAGWNIYPVHFTDGDNWGDADNRRCLALVRELLGICDFFGYGEINDSGVVSPLMNALNTLSDPRFVAVTLREKGDLYPALKRFFSPRAEVEGHAG